METLTFARYIPPTLISFFFIACLLLENPLASTNPRGQVQRGLTIYMKATLARSSKAIRQGFGGIPQIQRRFNPVSV